VRTLSLGYSPCPNDTFIFYALVHKKIDTLGLDFSEILKDVEELNRMAGDSRLDITKASVHAYGYLRDRYFLLRSGGALGKGCGPLLVSSRQHDLKNLKGKTIAIPGRLTTAFLLLQLFDLSLAKNIKIMPFDEIIDSVKKGHADAGLIIHESRFTYGSAGLTKLVDLGEWWENETGLPIPLGGILARRDMGRDLILKIEGLIRKSIEYGFSHRSEPLAYIKAHAQEMEDEVVDRHIDLYVNNYSLDIGEEGIVAVNELFQRAEKKGLIPAFAGPMFVSQ
jgi:1,4-dihydroxy-6-naphthoate synthase